MNEIREYPVPQFEVQRELYTPHKYIIVYMKNWMKTHDVKDSLRDFVRSLSCVNDALSYRMMNEYIRP
jgi:hypothetical protein